MRACVRVYVRVCGSCSSASACACACACARARARARASACVWNKQSSLRSTSKSITAIEDVTYDVILLLCDVTLRTNCKIFGIMLITDYSYRTNIFEIAIRLISYPTLKLLPQLI